MDELSVVLAPSMRRITIALDVATATAHDVRAAVAELEDLPVETLVVRVRASCVAHNCALATFARADVETRMGVLLHPSPYVLVRLPCARTHLIAVDMTRAFAHAADEMQRCTGIPPDAQRWTLARTGAHVRAYSPETFADLGIGVGDVLEFAAEPGRDTVTILCSSIAPHLHRAAAFHYQLTHAATVADLEEYVRARVPVCEQHILWFSWRGRLRGVCGGGGAGGDDHDAHTTLEDVGLRCGDIIVVSSEMAVSVRVRCSTRRDVCCDIANVHPNAPLAYVKALVRVHTGVDVSAYLVRLRACWKMDDARVVVSTLLGGEARAEVELIEMPADGRPYIFLKHACRDHTAVLSADAAISVGAVARFVEETWGIPRARQVLYNDFAGCIPGAPLVVADARDDALLADVGIHSHPVVRFSCAAR